MHYILFNMSNKNKKVNINIEKIKSGINLINIEKYKL